MNIMKRLETAIKILNISYDPILHESFLNDYDSPKRFYHNLHHISEGLSLLSKFLKEQPHYNKYEVAQIEISWIYHDCFYNAEFPSMNELNSANYLFLAIVMAKQSGCKAGFLHDLVMWTKHPYSLNEITQGPSRHLGPVLHDIDLAGLGSSWPIFKRNADFIRQEYAHVADATFYAKHSEFLISLLKSDIFLVPWFRERFEGKARENILKFERIVK